MKFYIDAGKATGVRATMDNWKPANPRRRILLVEDDSDSLEVTRRLLERDGHVVSTATCLKHAIDTAGGGFDVLIADIGLPDGTGIDLIEHLKTHGPVLGIALSGYGMRADVESCRAAGFKEHLTKPIKFDDLRSAIDRVCRGVLVNPPASPTTKPSPPTPTQA